VPFAVEQLLTVDRHVSSVIFLVAALLDPLGATTSAAAG
jgi:hypothetical protein